MIIGGITFRNAIDHNKSLIVQYLSENGASYTADIRDFYKGEKQMHQIRKALNELRKEGKITTDDKVSFWRGKLWSLYKQEESQSL